MMGLELNLEGTRIHAISFKYTKTMPGRDGLTCHTGYRILKDK